MKHKCTHIFNQDEFLYKKILTKGQKVVLSKKNQKPFKAFENIFSKKFKLSFFRTSVGHRILYSLLLNTELILQKNLI